MIRWRFACRPLRRPFVPVYMITGEKEMADHEARLVRLEEGMYFQEQRLEALHEALVRQQRQLDDMERQLAEACLLLRLLREQFGEQGLGPENALPPHYMPERY